MFARHPNQYRFRICGANKEHRRCKWNELLEIHAGYNSTRWTRVAGSGEPSGVSHSHKTVKAITMVAPRASKALCSAHSTYWSSTAEFAPLDDQVPSAHSPSCSKAHISASPSMSVSRRTARASFRRLSAWLRGDRLKRARLNLSPGPVAALDKGQEPRRTSGKARGRGGLGLIGWSAVHLQMAGSVYCVSPNRWPTWPRVNIQVASLVN